ncbi:MAG TPA: VOC family protein [Candidatus Acidoferrum sp.]|nr:VOC family protein [Candidatus Acidoferrum sp.]
MPAKRKSLRGKGASAPTFNHAMIYSRDVGAALGFYADTLGFKLLENFQHEGRSVYARLKSAGGNTTIALHAVAPGDELRTGGVRLYFEVRDLERFCERLESIGVRFSQKPKQMPWGWKHAYLNDPDGHEVSLYWAGGKRLRRST